MEFNYFFKLKIFMFSYLRQIWNTPGLRKKILFTVFILVVFRVVAHIPVPGIDPEQLKGIMQASGLDFLSLLTGGSIENFSIVLMGLSPYINASIIVQLLTVIVPKLESLSKEGEQGRNKINQYTRWIAFPLAFLQSYGMILLLNRLAPSGLLDVTRFAEVVPTMLYVSAGTIFLMWLGELITEKGIGNGISLLIFAGIVANIPQVVGNMLLSANAGDTKTLPFLIFTVITIVMLFFIIMFTEGNRNIPITYAGRGAKSEKSGLPIRVNQAGMIPIIFAISMISFPSILSQFFANAESEWLRNASSFIQTYLNSSTPGYTYMLVYFLLILGFSYFYISITFNPDQIAENLQKRGGFIPGIRPGKQSSDYIAKVSSHLNLFGGVFLALIAIIPILFTRFTDLSTSDLLISGSGLIIVVGVVLELIRQINAQLVMHDYERLV